MVTTSGELRARKFMQISVPANVQQAEAYQMQISSIVPEGTVVKEGNIVAELDRSTRAAKLADVALALQNAEAVSEQAMLDSTLNLSKAREEMRNMELVVEEKRLAHDDQQCGRDLCHQRRALRATGSGDQRRRCALGVFKRVGSGPSGRKWKRGR